MRLRILMGVLLAAIGLTVATNCWPFGDPGYSGHERPLPQSRLLVVSFLGYTNGNAIIEVKNRSSQAVDVNGFIEVYSYAPDRVPDFRYVDGHTISRPMPLPAGAAFMASFPAPTNHGKWKAAVGGIGQREVNVKQALARTWFFRHWHGKLVLHICYAQTGWIIR